nr:peptidyl-prolyl cis-trans isomerase CYP21-4-like [Tanacetum cinerariifolium]
YLYGMVAIIESLWLLSSSSSLLKMQPTEDAQTLFYAKKHTISNLKRLFKSFSKRKPQSNEEIWWLPVPWVSAEGLSKPARKHLRQKNAMLQINQKGHLKGMLFQLAVKHFVIQRRDSHNHLVIEDWASREMHYNQLQKRLKHEWN